VSGIVGINFLDKQPARIEVLGFMVDALAQRGPDDVNIWIDGAVGLGHTMLRTTPESLHEIMPLKMGDLIITADARIDNRDELCSLLGMDCQPMDSIPDSLLILLAYERWGERCPEMLLGDFAFAIWDTPRSKLFCARDIFGVRPFYYSYLSDRYFVFGSEIKAILCVKDIPRRLNEVRVAYHLQGDLLQGDKTSTFYRDILRLPPAHSLTVTPQGLRLINIGRSTRSGRFTTRITMSMLKRSVNLFTEAVRCRLRSAYPIGSELSGGLDSSSVTCVARKICIGNERRRVHTISGIFDDVPECDERAYINPVLAQGSLIPHFVPADQVGPLENLDDIQWIGDEPSIFPNTYTQWYLFSAAREQGIRILLDGEDGDSVVSYGYEYLSELARAGQWSEFQIELDALAKRYDGSSWSYLKSYGLSCLTELARDWKWLDFVRQAGQIAALHEIGFGNLLVNYGIKPLAPAHPQITLFNPREKDGVCFRVFPDGFDRFWPEFQLRVSWQRYQFIIMRIKRQDIISY